MFYIVENKTTFSMQRGVIEIKKYMEKKIYKFK